MGMGRFALTLWFTLTTLLGPGVCCCTVASAKPTEAGEHSPTKPVKSCCRDNTPPCCPDSQHHPEPGTPAKCPCEKGKQVTALPSAATTSDLSAQLKLVDALFVGLPSSIAFDLFAPSSTPAAQLPSASGPFGRELLAAYSVLRC